MPKRRPDSRKRVSIDLEVFLPELREFWGDDPQATTTSLGRDAIAFALAVRRAMKERGIVAPQTSEVGKWLDAIQKQIQISPLAQLIERSRNGRSNDELAQACSLPNERIKAFLDGACPTKEDLMWLQTGLRKESGEPYTYTEIEKIIHGIPYQASTDSSKASDRGRSDRGNKQRSTNGG